MVVQAGGTIELRDDRRQLDPDPPLVVAPSGGHECLAPASPPGSHEPGDRLDDQHRTPAGRVVQETGQERVTRGIGELIHGERGKNRRQRKSGGGDVGALYPRGEAELTIRPGRLGQRPRMAIDPDDLRPPVADCRPRRPCGPGSAPEIDEGGRQGRRSGQHAHDLANQQVVERAVEERKGCSLAGAGEGPASGEPVAPLDVGRGQRAERARDLRKREVREVPRFERANPPVEWLVANACNVTCLAPNNDVG
jgi:hypothetical protein